MKWVCLGDSITYGYPFGPEESWVSLIGHATGLTFLNKGVNGETTGEMLHRFTSDVLALQPTDLIVLGGTNDAWYRISLREVQKNISDMYRLSFESNIRMHLALPIPINESAALDPYLEESLLIKPVLDQYRHWMMDYAAEQKIGLIDFYNPMLDSITSKTRPDCYVDSGHPSQLGHQTMAATLLNYLKCNNFI
ncbi:MAG TPA: GDSL family lipase [Clostridia bacterium]|nr:GDSL family lipase [Clostridia bacterium]